MVGSQWEKFKQSNVARIFLAYAVVAFGLMQVFDYLLPIIEAPLWVAQTLTLLLFLGFPISLLVGWVTQRPIVSTENEALGSEPSYAQNLSRQKLILIGLGSSALFGFLGLILMPYLLDQASFSSRNALSDSSNILPSFRSLRYQINVGDTRARAWGATTDIALSPDGDTLVYTLYSAPNQSFMVKDMTSFEGDRLLTTLPMGPSEGYPQFSEDGQWIYYHQNGGIKRIRVEGGTPQSVIETGASASGVAVSGQKVIYHNPNSSGLEIFDIGTGQVSAIAGIQEKGEHNHTWPHILEDGKTILATRGTRGDFSDSSIDIIDLESGEVTEVIPVGFKGFYANSGHIIFARGNSIWAQPFDKESLTVRGGAVPIIFDTEIYEQFGNVGIALSKLGRLVFIDGSIEGSTRGAEVPVLVDKSGNERVLDVELNNYASPQFSPDETQLALQVVDGGSDVWVYDFEARTLGRRSFDSQGQRPIWSSNGEQLIYSCAPTLICAVASNGTETASQLVQGLDSITPNDQGPSGDLLVSQAQGVFRFSPDQAAENTLTSLELGPQTTEYAKISPDGNWIAYASNETGLFQIYVRPYPEIERGKWQVSRSGGRFPMWEADLSELFWWNINTREVFSSSIDIDNSNQSSVAVRFSNPEILFVSDHQNNGWPPIDYASETNEFVFIKDTNVDFEDLLSNQTHLSVIENWFEELAFSAPIDPNM